MTYRVDVTATAKADADAIYAWHSTRSAHAVTWFNGLVDAIESLAQMPQRCALCVEHRHFKEEVRQLLYGKKPNVYRILFIVRAGVVHVLHIRHAARRELRRMNFPPK